MSSTGWPSFYIEEITEHSASLQASVASLIVEGVFERFPELKIVLIEAGFAWIPALGWRLDQNWKRMKDEVPHLKRAPSEYLREHFWVSTQPMEEAEEPDHVIDVMEWIGWDKILFASDYPHWDFDDPFLGAAAEPERGAPQQDLQRQRQGALPDRLMTRWSIFRKSGIPVFRRKCDHGRNPERVSVRALVNVKRVRSGHGQACGRRRR